MESFKKKYPDHDEINLHRILDGFKRRWFIIPIVFVLALVGSWIYLRYTPPVYKATCTLRIDENPNKLADLAFIDMIDKFNGNILTEIEILKSNQMILEALSRMDAGISYYNVGDILTSELYKDSPFRVVIDSADLMRYHFFDLKYLGGQKFNLIYTSEGEEVTKTHYFGENIDIDGFRFRILRNDLGSHPISENEMYRWKLNQPKFLVNRVKKGLKVEQAGFQVSLIELSYEDKVPHFAADFLNELALFYIDYDREVKTKAADQALGFIQSQLDTMQVLVEESEKKLSDFKTQKQVVDIQEKGSEWMEKVLDLQTQKRQYDLAMIALGSLENQVKQNDPQVPLSFTLDELNPVLSQLVSSYNEVLSEKTTALQTMTPSNPVVRGLDQRLAQLGTSIAQNIKDTKATTKEKIAFFDKEIAKSESHLSGIPEDQRLYVTLEREYKVNENIFSTLLEKRAEASIAKASIVSAARIIDPAAKPDAPIAPIKAKAYLLGSAIGLMAGILIIITIVFLKNTITYKEDIERVCTRPVLGTIPVSSTSLKKSYPYIYVLEHPKSLISESFRAIRTNIQFIAVDKPNKVICTTSTISGEGKSFFTINLAATIALLEKKVIVLDFDMRKPKLHYTFNLNNTAGVSTFLAGRSKLEDVIQQTEVAGLDIVPSGPIPPNPSELIQSSKINALFEYLEERYDYILLDTPPVGLISDAVSLLKKSDIALYVLRADYSKRNFPTIPDQIAEEHDLKNIYLVLNSARKTGSKYGTYGSYGYLNSGYFEEKEEKKFKLFS